MFFMWKQRSYRTLLCDILGYQIGADKIRVFLYVNVAVSAGTYRHVQGITERHRR